MDLARIIESNIASFKGSKTQQNAAGVFVLKLVSTVFTFIAAILIARLAGSVGYGAYNFAMSWVAILSLVSLFGMHKLVVREYARYQTESAHGFQRGILRRADQLVLGLSIILILTVWGLTDWIKVMFIEGDSELLINSLLVALPLLLILGLLRLRQASLEAKHQAFIGNLPEMLLSPLLLVLFLLAGWVILNDQLSAYWALGAKTIASLISLIVVTWLRRNRLSEAVKQAEPKYETARWMSSAIPLLLISGLYVVNANTDIIMLGFLDGAESTGLYAAASKGALLITFVMLAVNKTLSPNFAALYKNNEIEKLQSLVTHSVRVVSFVAILLMIFLVSVGHWYLLVFGQEFVVAHLTLAILCFGKVFSGIMGSVGHLLIMTGHERVAAWNVALAVVVNIILNYLLIPVYGIEGAAISSTVSFILVNLMQAVAVYKLVNINPTIFRMKS